MDLRTKVAQVIGELTMQACEAHLEALNARADLDRVRGELEAAKALLRQAERPGEPNT